MMLGALVLGSCVKNEESQSVKDIRRARAEEIRTQAELNMANVQATITLANAQAAIAAAEAKLKEAEAAIAMAEAAKKQAEAELIQVQVQIAQVQLQEEQVKLLAKRAELEKLIAQYEAEIAKYAADKQEALNRLEAAEAQAVIDQLKAQIDLLKQEEKLMKAISSLEAERQKQIGEAWNNYTAQVTALNKAQTELISKMAQLAKLEAGEETAEEILVKKIQDLYKEIAAKELYIAHLEDQINMSAAEIDAALTLANAELAEAYTQELQAQEAMNFVTQQLNNKKAADYVYEKGWNSFISWFENLDDVYKYKGPNGYDVNLFYKDEEWNPETQRYEVGVYYYFTSEDPNGGNVAQYNTFVPLYTSEQSWGVFTDYDASYIYPYSVDGEVPAHWAFIEKEVYTPAKIYFDNVYELIQIVASIEEEKLTADVEWYDEQKQFYTEYIQKKREVLAAEIAAQTAFVEEAAPVVFPAYQAYRAAYMDYIYYYLYGDRSTDYWVAYDNYYHYIDVHNSTANAKAEANALADVKTATENLITAQKNFDDISLLLYGSVPNSVTEEGEGDEGEEIVEGLIAKVPRLETAAFNAGKVAAEKKAALAEPEKEWTEKKEALEKAVQDANEALVAKEAAIIKAQDEEDTALEAYHKAVIIYTADPNDDTEKAMKEAEEAWKAAQKKVSDLQAELPDLEKAVSDAVAAKDKVYNPYKEAKDAYDTANKIYTEAKQEWTIAKNQLGTREDDPSTSWTAYAQYKYYKARLTQAVSNKEQAEKNLKEAQEKNEGDEELNNLRMALYNLDNMYDELYQKYVEAWDVYSALVYGDEYADPVVEPTYPNFWETYYHVTPGASVMFPEMYEYTLEEWGPGQNLARYEWYGEQAQWYKEYYQNKILQSDYATFVQKINDLVAHIAEYEVEEEAYLEHIAEMQEFSDAYNAAQIAWVDATNERIQIEAAKNALTEIKGLKMFSAENGEAKTVEEFEKLIENEKKELIDLEKDLQHLINELYFGKKDHATGEYTAAKIAELENEIQKLQNEIEFRAGMIEYYLELLSFLMEADIEPVD